MKKIIIYGFLSLMIVAACRKNDNERVPEFTKVPMPVLKKVSGSPTIDVLEADKFTATFSIGLYYPDAEKPAKFDLVIRKNANNATTKVIKADITTYPSESTITGPQLKTLFNNEAIKLGDKFDLGVDITLSDGRKFLAFPTVGVPYSAGVASVAGSATITTYEAICAFKMPDYGAVGSVSNYKVLEDGWNDIGKGQTLAVTVVSDRKFSFVSPVNGQPIVIDVDPVTNVTSAVKQPYGDYKAAGIDPTWTYGVASAESVTSANNFVAPCDLIISIQLSYTVAAGGFGDFQLKLQKL